MKNMFPRVRLLVLGIFVSSVVPVGCADSETASVVPVAPAPATNESAWTLDLHDDGSFEQVTTPSGDSVESAQLDEALESFGDDESLAPVRVLRRYVNVGVVFRNEPIGSCINRGPTPQVVVTLYVRGIAVTNVRLPGYWNGNALCTGLYDELSGLCGGPWCVTPAAAREAVKGWLQRVFTPHIGAALAAPLARVVTPQVLRKLQSLHTTVRL